LSPERNISLYKLHGIDSTRIPTFGDVTGTEEIKAVRQHTSVFQTILKLFAWDELNKSIERHYARDCVVGFSFKSQLVAMLYGQLAGSASLRDIESSLGSHANRLHAMHATPPRAPPWPTPTTTARLQYSTICSAS
jgi:hypothetical protein